MAQGRDTHTQNAPIYSRCFRLAFNMNIIYGDWGWALKQTGCWILRHFHPLCFHCINQSLPLFSSGIVATSRSSDQWLSYLWASRLQKIKSKILQSGKFMCHVPDSVGTIQSCRCGWNPIMPKQNWSICSSSEGGTRQQTARSSASYSGYT